MPWDSFSTPIKSCRLIKAFLTSPIFLSVSEWELCPPPLGSVDVYLGEKYCITILQKYLRRSIAVNRHMQRYSSTASPAILQASMQSVVVHFCPTLRTDLPIQSRRCIKLVLLTRAFRFFIWKILRATRKPLWKHERGRKDFQQSSLRPGALRGAPCYVLNFVTWEV